MKTWCVGKRIMKRKTALWKCWTHLDAYVEMCFYVIFNYDQHQHHHHNQHHRTMIRSTPSNNDCGYSNKIHWFQFHTSNYIWYLHSFYTLQLEKLFLLFFVFIFFSPYFWLFLNFFFFVTFWCCYHRCCSCCCCYCLTLQWMYIWLPLPFYTNAIRCRLQPNAFSIPSPMPCGNGKCICCWFVGHIR